MNVSFPNRDAIISRSSELHVIRRLAANSELKVRAGERIMADHVIAKSDAANRAIRVAVSDQLGIAPGDVTKHLLRPVGSSLAAGEALAKMRRGLRNVVVATPAAGTLVAVDTMTGVALLAPGSASEIRALVAGDIEYVDANGTVSIRTVGTRLYGIVGIGMPVRGSISVAVGDPGQELQASSISKEMRGQIIVGGAFAGAAAMRKLMEVGAAGLITGGIVDRELVACFGMPAEDRLAPWRLGPSDVGIGDGMLAALSLMATEGFGRIPMHPQIFELLRESAGREAALIPTTRTGTNVARPQLIVIDEAALDEDAPPAAASLAEGSSVRLVEAGRLGAYGTVKSLPKRRRRSDGQMIDVVDVECSDGRRREAAYHNIELIA